MQELFDKYLANQCSVEEVKKLLAHFNVTEDEKVLRRLITKSLEEGDEDNNGEQEHVTDKIFAAIKKQINSENAKVVPFAIIVGGISVFA